jgi:hypothetical protein
MKKNLLLLVLFVTLFSSCESNDALSAPISESDIIGDWNLTAQTIDDGQISITTNNQTVTANYSVYSKDISMVFSFTDTPKLVTLSGKYTTVATYSFLGQTNTEEETVDTSVTTVPSSSWMLNADNTITITENSGLPAVLIVEEFTANYLKLKGEINQTETDGTDSITTSAIVNFTFER